MGRHQSETTATAAAATTTKKQPRLYQSRLTMITAGWILIRWISNINPKKSNRISLAVNTYGNIDVKNDKLKQRMDDDVRLPLRAGGSIRRLRPSFSVFWNITRRKKERKKERKIERKECHGKRIETGCGAEEEDCCDPACPLVVIQSSTYRSR